jgi:PST family polysaccharide transporter
VGQVAVNVALGALGFWWTLKRAGRGIRLRFDRALAVWMLRFGAVMSLGALATILLLQFDNFLVGTFVGAAALGYYAQAYKVAQWPTGLVTHIVSRAALPTYAKLQDDLPRLAKAFGMTLWLILMLATPLALAIFVSAPDFLILLYGEKWLPSAILLRFLIIYSVLRPLLDDTGALFTAIGQPHRATIVLIVQALTLVIAATPFTLTFNAIGTAVGVGLAFVVGIALTYRFVARTIPVDLARLFIPTTLAAAISVALYLAFAHLVDLNALPLLARVLVKSSVAAGVFFGSALLLERGALIERVGYIWRLLRSSAA